MSIADWIAIGIIAFALVCAVIYIVKGKRNGCIGCPYAGNCGKTACERKKNDE